MATETMKPGKSKPKVWLMNGVFVIFTHLISLLAPFIIELKMNTFILMIIIWQAASLGKKAMTIGITMGYHRLWSHRSYEAKLPLRIILAFLGTMGFQGSIKWWAQRHRLHHRYFNSLTKDSLIQTMIHMMQQRDFGTPIFCGYFKSLFTRV